jgi:hypothetical protein
VRGWANIRHEQEVCMDDAGPEPGHDEDLDPEPGHDEDLDPEQAREEARRKFREALDRKRAREADADGGRGGADAGQVHGAHGPARNRRTFRRKSG